MGYASRQKKRKYKRIERKQRRRTPETAARWFLIIAKKPGQCGCCEKIRFERGAEIVYRHEPRAIFCLRCADREGIRYRPSLRWERSRAKSRGGRT
jgi:hypothetical protein